MRTPRRWMISEYWLLLAPPWAKIAKIAYFGGPFFGRKIALNRVISVGKSIFGVFDNFRLFLANPDKNFFFSIFASFLQPKYVFFGFLQNDVVFLASFPKNLKNTYLGCKNFMKNRKKIFFSGVARNRPKLSKSPKNRFSD